MAVWRQTRSVRRGNRDGRRRPSRGLALLACAVAVCAAAAACASPSSSGSNKPATGGKVKPGGTVTFAATQGVPPNFILPLVSASYATQTNINDFQFLMWRPLYWMGGPGTVGVNYAESLAGPPAVAPDGANTKITITLKHYKWSDGTPVTSRDVEFWINLLKANKQDWWDYAPGQFPDNILDSAPTLGPVPSRWSCRVITTRTGS